MTSTAELVPSVSIENMVNQRAAVMQRMRQAFELIQEAADIAAAAHVGMPRVTIATDYGRYADGMQIADARIKTDSSGRPWTVERSPAVDLERYLRLGVDRSGWQYLMHESGMRSMMDAQARKDWDKAVTDGDIPELTAANIRSTFGMLHASRGEIFERGVIAVFKGLSWPYKTNLPQKFGKRLVLTHLRGQMSGGQWGANSLGHVTLERCNALDDLSRVLSVLDGKPEPDHRQGWYSRISDARKTTDPDPADDYMSVRCFRNGNGHVTFKRLDLVEKMNLIVAKHYPGALPAPK